MPWGYKEEFWKDFFKKKDENKRRKTKEKIKQKKNEVLEIKTIVKRRAKICEIEVKKIIKKNKKTNKNQQRGN